jgi:hypothetical protein
MCASIMAQGPDPHRHPETDPEIYGHEQPRDGGIGSPRNRTRGQNN